MRQRFGGPASGKCLFVTNPQFNYDDDKTMMIIWRACTCEISLRQRQALALACVFRLTGHQMLNEWFTLEFLQSNEKQNNQWI